MKKIISVVIPVYNVNLKYFQNCLDSILNQKYQNFEVVIVLDGPNNEVKGFCEKYAQKDNRIVIFEQENKGVSVARNEGIRISEGKWITFVDADDWIERDTFEIFNKKVVLSNKDYDYIAFKNYKNKSENDSEVFSGKYNEDTEIDEEFKKYIFQSVYGTKEGTMHCCESVWKNFYRKEFLVANNIKFIEGLKVGEDLLFNFDVWEKCQNGKYINYPIYHYRCNEDSVINDKTGKIIKKYEEFFPKYDDRVLKLKQEYSINNEAFYLRQIQRFLLNCFFPKNNTGIFKENVKAFKKFIDNEFYNNKIKKININKINIKKKIFVILIRLKMYRTIGVLCTILNRK